MTAAWLVAIARRPLLLLLSVDSVDNVRKSLLMRELGCPHPLVLRCGQSGDVRTKDSFGDASIQERILNAVQVLLAGLASYADPYFEVLSLDA